jgi:hypothetical protein
MPARSAFKKPYMQFVPVERVTQGNTMQLDVAVGKDAMRAERSLSWTGGGTGAKGTHNLGVKLSNGSY